MYFDTKLPDKFDAPHGDPVDPGGKDGELLHLATHTSLSPLPAPPPPQKAWQKIIIR
jgi:hypothetical protein